MEENTLDRLKRYIEYKKTTVRALEMNCGFSNGSLSSRLKLNDDRKTNETTKNIKPKTIGVDRLEKILNIYKDLNGCWLLTGIGKMIKSETVYLLKSEERVASEPNDFEIKYLKNLIQTKDDFIEKLQKNYYLLKKKDNSESYSYPFLITINKLDNFK